MPITAQQLRSHLIKMGQPIPKGLGERTARTGYRNKWEAEYASYLQDMTRFGILESWHYESVKLKIGNGAFYMPDFMLVLKGGVYQFHEVKGFQRQAGMVRLRAAAMQYAFWRFYLITKVGGEWSSKRI